MSEDGQTLEQGDAQLDPSNLDAESLATPIPDELVVKVAGKVAEQITPILSRTFESRIDTRIEELSNQIDRKLGDINTNLWNKTQEYLAKVVDKTKSEATSRVTNPVSATRGSANKKHITVTPEALEGLKQQYANEQGQWEGFFRDIIAKKMATEDPDEMAEHFSNYMLAMEKAKQAVAKSMGYGGAMQPSLEDLAQARLEGINQGLNYNLRDTLRRGGFRDETPFDLPVVDTRKSAKPVKQSGKNSGSSSASPNWGREGKGISVKDIYRRDGKG